MVSWKAVASDTRNKNTLFILAEKGLSLPLNFITFIVMAARFGPSDYGLISFGLSIVALFAPFSKFAYETVITRHLAQGHPLSALFRISVRLRLLGSLIVFALLLATAFLMFDNQALLIFIGLMGVTIFLDALLIYDPFFQSILKSQFTTYSRSSALVVGSVLRIAIAVYLQDVRLIALSFVAERVITIFLMRFYFLRTAQQKGGETKVVTASELFTESLPLILTNVLILINFKIDQVLIEYFAGFAAVGIYAIAVSFSEVWYNLPIALMTSYFPLISKEIDDEKEVERMVVRLASNLIFLALSISVITTLVASFLVTTLVGPEYHPSAAILTIHIWASVFFFAGHPVTKILIAKNKTWINFTGKLIAALMNVALNLLLIPMYGIKGAALATLASYAFGYYFYYFLFGETRGLIMKITLEPVRIVKQKIFG
jgi:O-antigen/teichoic acid export membrane protein